MSDNFVHKPGFVPTHISVSVSQSTYNEIMDKLKAIGCPEAFVTSQKDGIIINMNGIALEREK